MEDNFDIEITYKGQIQSVPARMITMGFTYKIFVTIEGQECIFERDDESNWRAVLPYGTETYNNKMDRALVAAIGEALGKEFQ